jgi:small subunit ribosomal protein S16
MLVIRLARTGRKKSASYRVVAAEKSRAATGKFVEVLGHYNPHTKDLTLNKERLTLRVGQGAQPSERVLRLMVREGMELPKWAKLVDKKRAPKKEVEVSEEPTTDASAESETAEKAETEAKQEVTQEDASEAAETEATSDAE